MATDITGTADEKTGTITVKEGETDVKYVKEASLTALQEKLTEAEKAKGTAAQATTEADAKVSEAVNARTQAEAKVETLAEEIKKHTGTADELTKLKTDLATAQEAEKSSATELLELRRTFIINNYKVPPDTVNSKDLNQLKLYEEALKAVIGANAGNYAFGGSGGGAAALEGKSPMELAQMAYTEKK